MPQLAEAVVLQSFQELHQRVYEVYALPIDRHAIHDLLSTCFRGEALTHEYVEHFTSKVHMTNEETAIEIVRLDYDEVVLIDAVNGRYRVEADWNVGGVVTHQRHKHTRINRYRAVYTLEEGADGLRIVDTRMRNLERVRSVLTSGQGWWASDDGGTTSSQGYMSPLELLRAGLGKPTPADPGTAAPAPTSRPDDSTEESDP